MCSTVGSAGVEADVASADSALTRALTHGVEHLTHDQSTALLGQLRALTAKADALTLAVSGRSTRTAPTPTTAACQRTRG
jgi:hypothetical protein